MQELEIKVTHRVSPELNACTYGGDFWGYDVCPYHVRRNRAHGKKHPWKGIFPNVRFLING